MACKQLDRDLAAQLVRQGFLKQETADQYLAKIEGATATLREYLVLNHYVPEKQVLSALAKVLGLEAVSLRNIEVDAETVAKVPVRFAWYYKFMPVRSAGKELVLACFAPLDIKIQDELRMHLRCEPKVVLAPQQDVLDAINKYYGLAADTVERLTKDSEAKPLPEQFQPQAVEDLEASSEDASVSKLVNQILYEAYVKRATDIHIEPYRNKVRVRYRVDGVLIDANIPPGAHHFLPSIISRVKILANLSIVEKRLPQDGSAVVKTKEQNLDLRVSTIPTPWGESMVIRILPTDVMLLSLEKLGLDRSNLDLFRSLIKKPHGIVLVTGPTGSGKTTTLYACLNEINSSDRKIITLEDPIEYEMEGITQIQVNPKVKLNFAAGLRSVLRHDPDIIMVGEIRDLETAEIAIRTALTGHVVFSTLHTNDAASGITRLVEMGLEPFLVSSSIEAFVAQRLVRVICPDCKQEDTSVAPEIKQEIAAALHLDPAQDVRIYKGAGCDHCNRTGFYGRTAIYEVLAIDDDIRAAILDHRRSDDIKNLAMRKGMITLRQDGWRKVLGGVTTPEEVLNITGKDEPLSEPAPAVPAQTAAAGAPPAENLYALKVDKNVLKAKNEYNSRAYPRLLGRVGVRYAVVRQDPSDPTRLVTDKVEHASITKDLSAGGLRFVSGYTLAVGTILDLKVQLDKSERSIDCLAKVCRVEDDAMSAMYNVVVYYLDIPSGDRVKINNYVKAALSQQKKAE